MVKPGGTIAHAVADLERLLGGRLVDARKLTGGSSADVHVLDIGTMAGPLRRAVFRQHAADFKGHLDSVTAKEYGVLTTLHARGFAVPEPYLLHGGSHEAAPYLIMEWIDGEPNVAVTQLRDALEQMAAFLVQLHALPVEALAVAELTALEDPVEALPAYLPATETGDRLRAILAADTGDRVENPPVLVHGDFWPGNVLWQGGRLVAVIDWEAAAIGDPSADLACARVELLCQYGDEAMDHFTDRYLAIAQANGTALRLDSLALWEVYVSASALATMHRWGLDPDDETRRRSHTTKFFERAASELLR
jgi:aminoglycoside phosphotransferase (APT) family kinase protein